MQKSEVTYSEQLIKAREMVQDQLREIQKINDNLNPEARESIFQLPCSYVLCANSRGGKTYSILKLLSDKSYKLLDRFASGGDFYLLSPTWQLDPTMKKIIQLLKEEKGFDPTTNCFSDIQQGVEAVQQRMKQQRILAEQNLLMPHIMVICDDTISEFKQHYFLRFLESVFTMGRHLMVSLFVTNQSFRSLSNVCRRNATHIGLFALNNAIELDAICSELRSHLTKQQMMSMYNRVVNAEKYNYILVCQQRPPNERYLMNAQEVIII